MRNKLVAVCCFLSTAATASEDISCQKDSKKEFVVFCDAKKHLEVSLVSINGGDCEAPVFHHSGKGKFAIPGTKECWHTRAITLSIDGRSKTFGPL